MRANTSIKLIVLLHLAIFSLYAASNEVSIYSVSTSLNSYTQAQGSNGGGTTLYISGNNFSPNADDISIFIGPYPCNLIAQGSTVSMVSCKTTPMTDSSNRYGLSITMYTSGLLPVTCSISACRFNYHDGLTPYILQVYPSTAVGNQIIAVDAYHRITSIGDGRSTNGQLTYLLIDTLTCSTLDIIQEDVSSYSENCIYCNTFLTQEAGEYSFTERTVYGDAVFAYRALQTSLFSGKNYTVRIAPIIDNSPSSNIPNSGGTNGHIFTLPGTGFSSDPATLTNFQCFIGKVSCQVISTSQSSIQISLPPYQAGYETSGLLSQDPSDTSTQIKGYLGSFGARYTRYTRNNWKDIGLLVYDFRAGNSSETIVEDGYKTQLGYTYQNGLTNFIDYLRGYIYAPVSGEYLFETTVDDNIIIYLSKYQNNTNPANMQVLLRVDSYIAAAYDPYYPINANNVAKVTLSKGYYYFQVIARDTGGGNYYYFSVSTPTTNLGTNIINPTYQEDNVIIAPINVQPEIITVTVDSRLVNSTFQLYYYVSSNGVFTKVSSSHIAVGATASQFQSAISGLGDFSNYNPVVTLEMFDSSNATTTNNATAVIYQYSLTYAITRSSTATKLPTSTVASGVTILTAQNHSAGLGGTYSILINGVPLNVYDSQSKSYSTSIQVTNSLSNIQSALRTYYQLPSISELTVQSRNTNQYPDKLDFNIIYNQVASPLPITIITTALTGGTDNSISNTITNKRPFSADRPYFQSVPYEMLRMASDKPSIDIRYNQIPAICMDCNYVYQPTQQISVSSAVFNANNLGLTISLSSTNASSLSLLKLSDITVTLYGQPCVLDAASVIPNLICNFNTAVNSQGTTIPIIPAGIDVPKVHIRQFGFVNIDSSLALTNPLTISSISPTALGVNGGVTVTITGTGFPLSAISTPILSIQTVDNPPGPVTNYVLIRNQEVVFFFPSISAAANFAASTQLVIKLIYPTYTYKYIDTNIISFSSALDPTVTGLSLNSASPILKQTVVVTGSNFDLSPQNMKAYLYFFSNNTRKYELGILSVADSTSLTVVLGGGRSGLYCLRIEIIGKGMSGVSDSCKLSYEIVVNSISPVTGSIGGGYTMTITGSNFATASGSTQVFIGDGMNSICNIVTITSTVITCTVPQMISTYAVGINYNVAVAGRLIELSNCAGNCQFSYQNTDTVYLNPLASTSFLTGDTVTIVSNNSDISSAIVKVGKLTVTLTTAVGNTITFPYPYLAAGTYDITVSVNGANAYPILSTSTALQIGAISSTSGSNKGQIVSVTGNGFTSITDPNIIVYYICGYSSVILPLYSVTSTNISFEVPSNPSSTCKVNVTIGLNYTLYSYSQSAAKTPFIVVTDLDSLQYKIVASNTNSKAISFITARYLNSDGAATSTEYPMSWTTNGTNQYIATPVGAYLPCGTFVINVHFSTIGFADSTTNIISLYTCTAMNALAPASASASFGGQGTFSLSAAGFITSKIQNNEIRVCGMRAKINSADQTGLVFTIPTFVNAYTNNFLGLGSVGVINSKGNIISDSPLNPSFSFDGNLKTFYSSNSSQCYIGLDFGSNTQANITQIRYVPNPQWLNLAKIFDGAKFTGSNDGTTWTTIFAIDSQLVHTGWNAWLNLQTTQIYRYVRFEQSGGSSQCQLGELQFSGVVYSTITYSPTIPCDVTILFQESTKTITLPAAITYDSAKTAVITSISPSFGPSTGGTLLTITGSNFDTSSVTVTIDGIPCAVVSNTDSQIQCTTGIRLTPPTGGNSFVATSAGNIIIMKCDPYLYMDRWSSSATWGGEVPPRDRDTVYVPVGMTLLVDQSTPLLNSFIVEGGTVVFSDEIDMTLDANYFIFIGGQFRAGLEEKPYQHKLTITLHGGYYDKQLPYFGNKVLGCMNCIFNMHGIVRNPTWTELSSTVNPGDNTLTLITAVDWQVGEEIVVAATGYNHYESEQKTITAVSTDKMTLTVSTPFVYKHFSGIQTYSGEAFIMRAQVGLLTRNIVLQGDNMTDAYNHGSHLIFMGSTAKGLDATISYAEVRKCGQPKLIGRYCTHFHMAGEVPNSFVRGLAVHHSLARVLTIHGTHYLLIEKNVGYLVHGHNIFIEDGIETHNIIQDNLMISSITSQTLLQSDTSVASYWITNPSNTVRRNHAAGGDFYGFWYEIKPNPDGPSATPSICPTGMPLGQSSDNVAHTNRRFGLRIFNYAARQYPCLSTFEESLLNPFDYNPAIESVFSNYLLWKNQEDGLLGEQLGFTTFNHFLIIDSGHAGMQFFKANLTLQNVTAQNSVIVGYSQGNAPADIDVQLDQVRGLITPRTDGFKAVNISFVNFGATMTPLQSCSQCQNKLLWVTGGKTSFFSKISYQNILGGYIFWNKWRREIFVDEDGSLTAPIATNLSTNLNSPATITPYFPHLDIAGHCYRVQGLWNDSSFCDSTITIRALLYTNANPAADFLGVTLRTLRLSSSTDNDTIVNTSLSIQPMIIIKKSRDIPFSWAYPYATGYYYHSHFQKGIDFLHLSLAPSQYWQNNDGIVVRFNYTDQRQLYQIAHYYQEQLHTPFINKSTTIIDPTTCNNGEYYHDQFNRYLYTCISGRNKTLREWVDITGVRCRDFCPKSAPFGQRETFNRLWSNVTQWPNSTLPKAGQNVTIPYEWNLILDMTPPEFYYVLINGLLYFEDTQDLTFAANTIWVNLGGIYIGTATNPYKHQATIKLNGKISDLYTVLDSDASGNKMLAVTGAIEFYGTPITNTWTRLTAIASIGDTQITVQNATQWQVGNEIVVGSTYSGMDEDEVFKITAINGNIVSLNGSFIHQHYGSPSIVTSIYGGKIDVRGAVGLLTRNIKIIKGDDPDGWGCRIQLYSYIVSIESSSETPPPPTPVNGYAILNGVEIDGCGQYDTSYAGIRIEKLGSLTPVTQNTSITYSSIHNCNGYCLYIDTSKNITFDKNVFYFARRYIAYVLQVNNYAFTNNLLVGLRLRPDIASQGAGTGLFPDNAAYEQWKPINFGTDIVLVQNNTVQGSQGQGFVFPFSPCANLNDYPFRNNTAGSCLVAFVVNVNPGHSCIGASGFNGYASTIGLMANPPGMITEVRYQYMFFTDNQRGFTLRYAHEHDDNTMILRHSYFMGYSRPNCVTCYSDTTISFCNNGYAIRMFTATLTGEEFPNKKLITGFDVICTQQSFDAKAFLTNVTFENYRSVNTQLPYCSKMSVFRKHDGAVDATGVHNLYQSPCVNCDQDALAYFSPPNPSWLGWDGGCGQLECTGSINYFIHDHDGYFTQLGGATRAPSQLLANHKDIGDKETACIKKTAWNGYWCKFEEFAVLEYQSIAADYNTRMVWPIYLNYDGGLWNSTTNAWRQWEWLGATPLNKRLARFWSVVVLGKSYNMTYSSVPPSDSVYQIQKRQLPSGNANDWVIVRIYFPVPNVVLVKVSNDTGQNIAVPSYPSVNGVYQDLTNSKTICGANNYKFETNIIEFVVNGKNNCQVRLSLSTYLQLTTRFQTDIATFYSNNGPASVLSKIVALLNIDPSQIKIVSIRSGSVIVDWTLYPASSNDPVATPTNSSDPNSQFFVSSPIDPVATFNEMTEHYNTIATAIASNQADLGFPVLSVSGTITALTTSLSTVTLCATTFLYNSTSDTCYCDTGYANITSVCTSCSLIGNSTGNQDPTITSRCECKSTYQWSAVLNMCVCPANSIVDANGNCFVCTGLANSTGVTSSDLKSCVCNTNFVFQTNNTCICDDIQSYISTAGRCVSCTGVGNGTGVPLIASKQCYCNPTYIWVQSSRTCLCPSNSIVDANSLCFSCTGLINSTGLPSTTAPRTCQCKPTFEFQANNTCICPDPNSYIDNNGRCVGCSSFSNGTGLALIAVKQCQCLNTYVLSLNNTICACVANSIIDSAMKCFLCTRLANSTGKVANGSTCQCNPTFVFQTNNTCICPDINSYIDSTGKCVSCSSVSYGTGKPNIPQKICICNPTFIWTQNVRSCLCASNSIIDANGKCFLCTNLANSTKKVSTNNASICQCNPTFVFQANNTCLCPDPNSYIDAAGKCVPCSGISNGTGKANVAKKSCDCNPTYVWSQSTSTTSCLCPANSIIDANGKCFVCTSLANSTGKVNTVNASICQCNPTFVFQPSNNTCLCPDPNSYIDSNGKCVSCTGIGNSTGVANITKKLCVCTPTFVWSQNISTTSCLCPAGFILDSTGKCFNCSLMANGTGKVFTGTNTCECKPTFTLTDSSTCACPDPNSYISSDGKCIGCSAVVNGTGKANVVQKACICNPTYVWASNLASCLCPANSIVDINGKCFTCTNLANSNGKVSTANSSSCQCNQTFVFQPSTNTCICPDPNSYVDSSGKCVSCTNVTNGTGFSNKTAKSCVCAATFVYNSTLNSCLCPNGYYLRLNNTCGQCANNNCVCKTGLVFNISSGSCYCPSNSVIINNICYTCSNANSTGVVLSSNKCECLSSFVFIGTSCQCPNTNYVVINNTCINCVNIANTNFSGSGIITVNGTKRCSCKSQYTWSPITGTCECGTNSMLINTNCFDCSLLNNTAISSQSALSSCLCSNNLVFDIKNFVCYCNDSNSIIIQKTCVSCTSPTVNGLVKATATSCTCSSALKLSWNANTQSCVCVAGSFYNGTRCVLCSTIPNSQGTTSSGTSCNCNQNFVWNSNTMKCVCSPTSISVQSSCINCDLYIGASGVNPNNNAVCSCIGSLVWDSLRSLCVCGTNQVIAYDGSCISCTTATDPNIVGTVDKYNCKCANPYFWDNLQNKCVKCTSLVNGLAKGNSFELTCDCVNSYNFDIFTNKCVKTVQPSCTAANIKTCLDCSLIPQADSAGAGPIIAANTLTSRNTNIITSMYAKVASINNRYSAYQCYCKAGYFWQRTMKRCMAIFQ